MHSVGQTTNSEEERNAWCHAVIIDTEVTSDRNRNDFVRSRRWQ